MSRNRFVAIATAVGAAGAIAVGAAAPASAHGCGFTSHYDWVTAHGHYHWNSYQGHGNDQYGQHWHLWTDEATGFNYANRC